MGKTEQKSMESVKEQGFIYNAKTEKFNCRIITMSGRMESKMVRNVSELADEYGDGTMIFTNDGMIEVCGISFEDIDKVETFCREKEIMIGGTGAKVRPVINCQGDDCKYEVIDAYPLAEKIQELFYHRLHTLKLPNKFEIAVSGCPENCINSEWYDLGIVGIKMAQKGSSSEKGVAYRVFFAGEHGKQAKPGYVFPKAFTSEESLLSAIDRLIYFYAEHGEKNETLKQMVSRVGKQKIEESVLN